MHLDMKIVLALALVCAVAHCGPAREGYSSPGEVVQPEHDDNTIRQDDYNIPRGVTFFEVRVYHGFVIVTEEVEIDTINNFVVVHSPNIGAYKSMIVFHDYNRNMTLAVYPSTRHCYLFDVYPDVPEDRSYWFSFKRSTERVKAFDGKNMGRYKNHLYNITEDNVNRSVLTHKMRQFCLEGMTLRRASMLTMDELVPGSDEPQGSFVDQHLIYMPYVPSPGDHDHEHEHRRKRAAAPSSCPHLCTGGIRNGM